MGNRNSPWWGIKIWHGLQGSDLKYKIKALVSLYRRSITAMAVGTSEKYYGSERYYGRTER